LNGGIGLLRMPLKLTWDDLVIQNLPESDALVWLESWSGRITGKVAPVFISKFGDWFLRRPDGSTDEFSVIDGTYSKLAGTPDEFSALVNSATWHEQHLLSRQVLELHERGIIPQPGQCYGFAPHPALSGRIDIAHAMLMDIGVWQYICAQLFNGSGTTKMG
jgi:hypothetical protein